MSEIFVMNPNRQAALDTIAFSELGSGLLAASDNGYNVLVGATASHPLLFPTQEDGSPNYATHPNIYNEDFDSTAAGRYQLLHRFFIAYQMKLHVPNFGHDSQDDIALQQIKERSALALFDAGEFQGAILRINNIWASLPGSPYGQHTNKMKDLQDYFVSRGGIVAPSNT